LEFVGFGVKLVVVGGMLFVFDKKWVMIVLVLVIELWMLFLDELFGGLVFYEVDELIELFGWVK